MGFRSLCVINEDVVEGGKGFAAHSHRDIEILSYVLEGELEHRDSMGNGSVIRPGEVQMMRAGTGVTHSEYNHSHSVSVHFLQIWILPDQKRLEPAYQQKYFPIDERHGRLRVIASRDGRDGSLQVHQDVAVHDAVLDAGGRLTHEISRGRHQWLQIIRGGVVAAGIEMAAGDGLAVSDEASLEILARSESELLLFDLP